MAVYNIYNRMESKQQKYMLIEHMEEYLYEWCKDEYLQVLSYLKNSKQFTPILSNYKSIAQFAPKSQEDKQDNEKHLSTLMAKNNSQHNRFQLVTNEINDSSHFEEEGKLAFSTESGQKMQFDT